MRGRRPRWEGWHAKREWVSPSIFFIKIYVCLFCVLNAFIRLLCIFDGLLYVQQGWVILRGEVVGWSGGGSCFHHFSACFAHINGDQLIPSIVFPILFYAGSTLLDSFWDENFKPYFKQ